MDFFVKSIIIIKLVKYNSVFSYFLKHDEMTKLLLKIKTYLTGIQGFFSIFILVLFSYNQVDLENIWCFNKYKT
jgi:hypothetical protein